MGMPRFLQRWLYGRYHGTLTRMVTNEESVQIVFSCSDAAEFDGRLGGMLTVLRNHMIRHNESVVLAMKSQIEGLMKQIQEKGQELQALDERLDKKRKKLDNVAQLGGTPT